VARADAPKVTTRLLKDLAVADLTIEDPPIEDVIEHVFASATAVDQPAADEAAPAAAADAPAATDDTPVAGPTP
jgi:hypothetical protein